MSVEASARAGVGSANDRLSGAANSIVARVLPRTSVTRATSGGDVAGLRDDLETPVALSELATRYAGTPIEVAIADAALTLVQSGTAIEMDAARRLPFEKAPNAFDRPLTAVERDPDRFARDGWNSYVLWKLTQLRPDDPRIQRLAARLR